MKRLLVLAADHGGGRQAVLDEEIVEHLGQQVVELLAVVAGIGLEPGQGAAHGRSKCAPISTVSLGCRELAGTPASVAGSVGAGDRGAVPAISLSC